MTPEDLASYFTSGKLNLVFAAISFLIVRALDRWTPDTMFTTAKSKLVANAIVSAGTPMLVALTSGLIANLPPIALVNTALVAFFGSAVVNTVIPMKPKQKDVAAGTDGPVSLKAASDISKSDLVVVATPPKSEPPKGAARRSLDHRVIAAVCALALCSCGLSGKAIVTDVSNVTNAICKVAETQPEPESVIIACAILDAGGQVANTFTVKVPKSQMAAELARRAAVTK